MNIIIIIITLKNTIFIFFLGESEICYVDNQSDGEDKNSLVTVRQEYNACGKTLGFVYELKQNEQWTKFFNDEDGNSHLIKNHVDFFNWVDLFVLLVMYGGLRFLSLVSCEELMLSAVLGKNIRRHQPFDFGSNFSKSVDDPKPLKEQATSNVMAYFIPKFIVGSMLDLIYDNDGNSFRHARVHTLTYKDPNAPIAPIISRQLLRLSPLFKKNPATPDQYTFKHFFHLVEEEETPHSDDVGHFINVPKITPPFEPAKFENMFKLSLHACPFVLKERLDCSSKYPKRSLASKYAMVGQ